jgi:hypothetical protein
VIRGRGIKLPVSQCHALVMSNTADHALVEQLVETPVKLYGVPPPFLYSDRLLVGARELGRPLSVDEMSLTNDASPVRTTMGCRVPSSVTRVFCVVHQHARVFMSVLSKKGPRRRNGRPLPHPHTSQWMRKKRMLLIQMDTGGTGIGDAMQAKSLRAKH